MPVTSIKSFSETVFLQLLRQPIIGTVDITQGANVSGLTLIFDTPSSTVTFTGTNPLSANDIVSQINSTVTRDVASLGSFGANGSEDKSKTYLVLAGDTSSSLEMDGAGTANSALGLPSTDAVAQDVDPTKVIHCGRDVDGYFRAIVVS